MTTFDDVNVVLLEGVLYRAAEVKRTAGGKTVARFTLMSTRSYLKSGSRVVAVTYVDVEAWGASAELLAENGTAATRVRVSGSLSDDTYHASGRRGRVKILADRLTFPHGETAQTPPTKSPNPSNPAPRRAPEKVVSREQAAGAMHSVLTALTSAKRTRGPHRFRR